MNSFPIEFSNIGLPGPYIKKGNNEFAMPCPKCGGKDRFVVWTDRPYPNWNYLCRTCTPDGEWLDDLFPEIKDKNWKISPQERAKRAAEYAREREESLKREIEKAQLVLKELQEARSWLRYHEQLDDFAKGLYEQRGIPEFFQEFWKFGYSADKLFISDGEEWHTPTLTIPIFEPGWNCINVRHRLLNHKKLNDKYRPDRSGLPAALYVADPDKKIENKTFLVEGEFKAMTTFVTIDDPGMQVIGIPGKNCKLDLLNKMKNCDPVYICLDPDAKKEAQEIANIIGRSRSRVVNLPGKIDDMINEGILDKEKLKHIINTSKN